MARTSPIRTSGRRSSRSRRVARVLWILVAASFERRQTDRPRPRPARQRPWCAGMPARTTPAQSGLPGRARRRAPWRHEIALLGLRNRSKKDSDPSFRIALQSYKFIRKTIGKTPHFGATGEDVTRISRQRTSMNFERPCLLPASRSQLRHDTKAPGKAPEQQSCPSFGLAEHAFHSNLLLLLAEHALRLARKRPSTA